MGALGFNAVRYLEYGYSRPDPNHCLVPGPNETVLFDASCQFWDPYVVSPHQLSDGGPGSS